MATRGLIPITLLLATCTIWAKDFAYKDLPTARLPYGETIGVTGKLEDIKSGLSALMEVEALSVTTAVSGLQVQTTEGTVTGDAWHVTVGPFPENAVVKLSFSFAGRVTPEQAETLMDEVKKEEGFKQAIERLAREAPRRTEDTDQVYEVRRVAEFEAFAKSVVEALRKHLPSELTLSDGGESFAETFLSRLNDADVVARLARTRN